MRKPLLIGCLLWLTGTLVLRLAGRHVVPTSAGAIVGTFVVSFAAMAWLARRVCRSSRVAPADWPTAAVALAAPTLLLDPFSAAFFPVVFPNIPATAAGAFGGWMLCCVGGALCGATLVRPAGRPEG